MKTRMASFILIGVLAAAGLAQETEPAPRESAQLTREQLEAALEEAKQAAGQARAAAEAANQALREQAGAAEQEKAPKQAAPTSHRWRRARQRSQSRRARIESRRSWGLNIARPTVRLRFLDDPISNNIAVYRRSAGAGLGIWWDQTTTIVPVLRPERMRPAPSWHYY